MSKNFERRYNTAFRKSLEFIHYIDRGVVKEIDNNNYLCVVQARGNLYPNISLSPYFSSIEDNPEYFSSIVIVPKLNSSVTFLITEKYTKGNLLFCDEIDYILIGDNRDSSNEFIINIDYTNKDINILNGNMEFKITQGEVDFKLDNTNIKIESGNVYINTENNTYINGNTKPIGRGDEIENRLNDLYDYVVDIYSRLGTHIHVTPSGPSSPPSPPNDSITLATKIVEVNGDKALTPNIKSTKNFTE